MGCIQEVSGGMVFAEGGRWWRVEIRGIERLDRFCNGHRG